MSGHSKWAQIKRQKGVADSRRGQLFTKLTREIMVAVRQGGSNPEMNPRLRLAMQKAREQSMPLENIERAIKRASGEGEGVTLVESVLEGYGPGGIALFLEILTDNRNRTLQEVRSTIVRSGGSLGEAGCVAWLFEPRGVIIIEIGGNEAEEIALWAIDAGAEEVKIERGYVEIHTKLEELEEVRHFLEEKGLSISSAEPSMVPKTTLELDDSVALQVLKLIDRLEGLEDVQRVFSNADFSYSALEEYQFTER